MNRKIYDLQEKLFEELGEFANRKISTGDAEVICSLATAAEKIEKLKMYEYGQEYSRDGGSYDNGMSEARYYRTGGRDSYGRDSYDRGETYANRGKHYVRGHYSREEGRDHMKMKLQDMMEETDDMMVKDAIRQAVDKL